MLLFKKIFQINTFNSTHTLIKRSLSQSIPIMKVFVTQPIQQETVEFLKANQVELIVNNEVPISREKFLESVKDCDGLFCTLSDKVDKELLDSAKNLKAIATCSVGYDHVDMKECLSRNISVGYTPGVLTDATAELTIGLLLNTSRKISESMIAAKTGEWKDWKMLWMCGQGLSGSKVGILGLGRIGLAIAKRLENFDTEKIMYHNRNINTEANERGFEYVSLERLLSESDFLICTCALTSETKNFFDIEKFKQMKKNAIFINISRGTVVNQDDLVKALKENLISGAGLDVTTPEPLPIEHELFKLANCCITPHIGSAELSTRNKMAMISAKNLIEGLNMRPMPYQIKL